MKTIAIVLAAATLTSAAFGQSTTYYDSRGSVTGRSTTLTFYDARGSKVGSETRLGATTTVYDAHVGSSTTPAPPPSARAFGFHK